MTYPDGTNIACIVVSSDIIHVSVMEHMSISPNIIDYNRLVLLTINLAFIRQHFI